MIEVGTYPPPGVSFGPISPLALLVFVTGLLSSGKATGPSEVSDARWNQFVRIHDALTGVTVVDE